MADSSMMDDKNADRIPAGEDPSDDEEIIELTDEIAPPQEADEEIIELTDALEDSSEEAYDFATVLGLELEPPGDVLPESAPMPEPTEIADREPSIPSGSEPLSVDQLEEIIARVIEKQFSRKIETMLATVVEKAVAMEIRRLKEAFLDERADDL